MPSKSRSVLPPYLRSEKDRYDHHMLTEDIKNVETKLKRVIVFLLHERFKKRRRAIELLKSLEMSIFVYLKHSCCLIFANG